MKVGCRLRLIHNSWYPSWYLFVMLEAISQPPFEPLECVEIWFLSFKSTLLLAIIRHYKWVGELHALSAHRSCLCFAPGLSEVTLQPNSAFVPEVSCAYNRLTLELLTFHRPLFSSMEEEHFHLFPPFPPPPLQLKSEVYIHLGWCH
jgi:hypothetical protein